MAPKSRKMSAPVSADDMNVRVSVLEHTVVAQNAEVNKRLESMEKVLKEIHDKQDTYILASSVKMEGLQGQINLNAEKTAAVNSKVNKFFAGLITIFAAILGGVFSMPELFGLKK